MLSFAIASLVVAVVQPTTSELDTVLIAHSTLPNLNVLVDLPDGYGSLLYVEVLRRCALGYPCLCEKTVALAGPFDTLSVASRPTPVTGLPMILRHIEQTADNVPVVALPNVRLSAYIKELTQLESSVTIAVRNAKVHPVKPVWSWVDTVPSFVQSTQNKFDSPPETSVTALTNSTSSTRPVVVRSVVTADMESAVCCSVVGS